MDGPVQLEYGTPSRLNCRVLGLTLRSVGYLSTLGAVHLRAQFVVLYLRVRKVWPSRTPVLLGSGNGNGHDMFDGLPGNRACLLWQYAFIIHEEYVAATTIVCPDVTVHRSRIFQFLTRHKQDIFSISVAQVNCV